MVDTEEPGAAREKTFLLAGVESRALEWIARRLPAHVLPDHLTALGVHATLLDAVGLAAVGAMLAGLGVRAARNLRRLAEREPRATPRAA